MDPVAVELARLDIADENVPIVEGPVPGRIEADNACRLPVIGVVEEEQLDGSAAFREDAEVHPVGIGGSPERVALARQNVLVHNYAHRCLSTDPQGIKAPLHRCRRAASPDGRSVPIRLRAFKVSRQTKKGSRRL